VGPTTRLPVLSLMFPLLRQYPPPEPIPDNRPRCPKCGERLEDDKAPWCWEELLDGRPIRV
jgi:hypothetical protein